MAQPNRNVSETENPGKGEERFLSAIRAEIARQVANIMPKSSNNDNGATERARSAERRAEKTEEALAKAEAALAEAKKKAAKKKKKAKKVEKAKKVRAA